MDERYLQLFCRIGMVIGVILFGVILTVIIEKKDVKRRHKKMRKEVAYKEGELPPDLELVEDDIELE